MKFIHLSDLHITANDEANEPMFRRLSFCAENYQDHFFLITGDIVDNEGAVVPGTPLPIPGGDFSAVMPTALQFPPPPLGDITPHLFRMQAACDKALALLSLLPTGRVIIIPGNHDYGLWGILYDEHFIRAWDDHLFTKLNRASDGTFNVMATVLGGNPLSPAAFSARNPISYVITQAGEPTVALLALNTVSEPGPDPSLLATGQVGGAQLDAIRNYFFGSNFMPNLGQMLGICQICLLHHHPWVHSDFKMRLRDADQLLAELRNKSDLILFGHRHLERRYEPDSVPGGGLRFGAIAAGSSRAENHAYRIDINSINDWRIETTPII